MSKNNPILHWIGAIARTLLGLTFIFSGTVKAIDPLGTTYKIEDYLGAFGGFFTSLTPAAEVAAWMLIAFEFVLGWLLLCNVRTKVSAWLAFAMMMVMTPLTLYLAITNPISDCGCFGDAIVLSNWATFWKNVVLMALVIILLCTKKYIPQLFERWAEWAIAGVTLCAVLGLMTFTRLHLPLMDFRPYKVGNNITKLMNLPEEPGDYEVGMTVVLTEEVDSFPVNTRMVIKSMTKDSLFNCKVGKKMLKNVSADQFMVAQDEYEIKFLMEKDGVQKVFPLSEYPDETWTFVEQRSELVFKGYEPKIHDFEILSDDFDDMTYDILEEDTVILAILYKVERCNMKQAKRLNEMALQAEENGTPFYLITGSANEYIEKFIEESGYEQPIYHCDGVTLKTIVRANPGIVKLSQGTVIEKYNLRNK